MTRIAAPQDRARPGGAQASRVTLPAPVPPASGALDAGAMERAVQSFAQGAYARALELLGPPAPLPAWLQDDLPLQGDDLPPQDAASADLEVCAMALRCAALRRQGQADAAFERTLTGPFWDWQSLSGQQLIDAALTLGTVQPDSRLLMWQMRPLADTPLGRALLFELALESLLCGADAQALDVLGLLQDQARDVLAALMTLRAEQRLPPLTQALLDSVGHHPQVWRVLGHGQRLVRLNFLTNTAFLGDAALSLGGRRYASPAITLAGLLLLSEGAPSTASLREQLQLSGAPGTLIRSIRALLGADSVIVENSPEGYTYRLASELSVSSDLQDLEAQLQGAPLEVLRRLAEALEKLEGQLATPVGARLSRLVVRAAQALTLGETVAGLAALNRVMLRTHELRAVMAARDALQALVSAPFRELF